MADEKLTLQQMCDMFSVTPRTLRYYEYVELLAPERDGRKRLYGPRERARLTLILRGRRFGFSLEEIRQWLDLYSVADEGSAQAREWITISSRQIAELEKRRTEIDEAIAELKDLRELARQKLA